MTTDVAREIDEHDHELAFKPFPLSTGRFLAETGRWFVQLRIDAGGTLTVSADLSSRTRNGSIELWVKTESASQPNLDQEVRLRAEWVDGHGDLARGSIVLRAIDEQFVHASFHIDRAIAGLNPGFSLTVRAARISNALREVGYEVERESGVDLDISAEFESKIIEVKSVLRNAGLEVRKLGETTIIPRPKSGKWSASDAFTALNEQLRRATQADLSSPAWELHLLLLSESNHPGLLGVMFDFVDELPRQGAAVFVNEIRRRVPESEVPQRVLATVVHELGHCLNLVHRFGREVGRADSHSFMNYDWLYEGGNRATAYWEGFRYEFDVDELEFLRHAPRNQVIPGGASFGSARYWITGDRPGVPSHPVVSGLQLWLTPPSKGTVFQYHEPVFLQVSLRNVGDSIWCLPRHVLDIKAGLLELQIQRRLRRGSGLSASTDREPFVPFMRRCFDVSSIERVALRPGESLHNNINLTFGLQACPLQNKASILSRQF